MDRIELFVVILIVATLVALLASRYKLPLTPALLLLGLLLGAVPFVPKVVMSSNLILLVFLPPLLFEAAMLLDLPLLWTCRRGVAMLAVPGVLIATAIAAAIVHSLTGLS